jgi:hypothetical protein
MILIVDTLDKNYHIIIQYDIQNRLEMKAFTVDGMFEIIWDEKGKAYIV